MPTKLLKLNCIPKKARKINNKMVFQQLCYPPWISVKILYLYNKKKKILKNAGHKIIGSYPHQHWYDEHFHRNLLKQKLKKKTKKDFRV